MCIRDRVTALVTALWCYLMGCSIVDSTEAREETTRYNAECESVFIYTAHFASDTAASDGSYLPGKKVESFAFDTRKASLTATRLLDMPML